MGVDLGRVLRLTQEVQKGVGKARGGHWPPELSSKAIDALSALEDELRREERFQGEADRAKDLLERMSLPSHGKEQTHLLKETRDLARRILGCYLDPSG